MRRFKLYDMCLQTSLEPPMSPLASLMPDHLPSPGGPTLTLPPAPPALGDLSPCKYAYPVVAFYKTSLLCLAYLMYIVQYLDNLSLR